MRKSKHERPLSRAQRDTLALLFGGKILVADGCGSYYVRGKDAEDRLVLAPRITYRTVDALVRAGELREVPIPDASPAQGWTR